MLTSWPWICSNNNVAEQIHSHGVNGISLRMQNWDRISSWPWPFLLESNLNNQKYEVIDSVNIIKIFDASQAMIIIKSRIFKCCICPFTESHASLI